MSEWLAAIAGTPEGALAATILALISAVAHAAFGALQKGRHDPWLIRGSIDFWLALISAPVALFLVPWLNGEVALILLGALGIHFVYKLTVALAYERAAYTVVYPVIRGTGPLVTVLAASVIFHEHFSLLQWLGVLCLSAGMMLLAARNYAQERLDRRNLVIGLFWAVAGGLMVALYTVYDAYGIRVSPDPFTFLAWFFFVTALDFPLIAYLRYRRTGAPDGVGNLMGRGIAGAFIAWVSFGGVMLATYLDKVGEAAVLRETSTIFAALIGWFVLGETVGPRRLAFMGLIALGAVIVEFGG
ncbi:DMT family transporter [Wenxinia marina]|uniref:Wenxma_16, whole genome shotgun sequence n=1 Tax=Wenxinia marina DSM 24838 TaxID=1123501 RepID=A0A0D0NIJ2_9RHOB|nr:DMT family transporter [Wenxinia marina]KIQ68140.1 EamA-like transporter family/Small Multidrug Resistance protein [Wenxinia marina DSM 24838]GGL78606.1 multidrug transporter [Wenxinia marina]